MLRISGISQFHEYLELEISISKTNDLLCALKLSALKRQMCIEDYFKGVQYT